MTKKKAVSKGAKKVVVPDNSKDRHYCLVCGARRIEKNMRFVTFGYICNRVCVISDNSWLANQKKLLENCLDTQKKLAAKGVKYHQQTKLKI